MSTAAHPSTTVNLSIAVHHGTAVILVTDAPCKLVVMLTAVFT